MPWRALGESGSRRLSLTFLASGCWRSMALARLVGLGANPETSPGLSLLGPSK